MGNKDWLGPLAGVVFVGLAIAGFAIGGEPTGADEPAQEIVDFYTDNKDSVQIGAILVGLSGAFLIFFAGNLRKALRAAEGEGGVLSAVSMIGAAVMAVGIGIDSTISFAIAERVDDIDPVAVQALQALWDNDFVPIAMGSLVFLWSTGISVVRHGALPKWLGWIAIALGVVAFTPLGFAAFLGGGVWILIASVMLAMRARTPSTGTATPGT